MFAVNMTVKNDSGMLGIAVSIGNTLTKGFSPPYIPQTIRTYQNLSFFVYSIGPIFAHLHKFTLRSLIEAGLCCTLRYTQGGLCAAIHDTTFIFARDHLKDVLSSTIRLWLLPTSHNHLPHCLRTDWTAGKPEPTDASTSSFTSATAADAATTDTTGATVALASRKQEIGKKSLVNLRTRSSKACIVGQDADMAATHPAERTFITFTTHLMDNIIPIWIIDLQW
ncbi:hypothetical protein TcWFU_008002 [Taenia crassiceps]|uniref:Uncharacterized protein n=1 Tax=Taenia crassiceps TaxID=6207 RepID=A0ABR4QLU7_9CEST